MSSSRTRQTAKRGWSRPYRQQPCRTSKQSTAATTNTATAAFTESKNYVQCSICLEDITQPKKLACGHTFCTPCIHEYFRHCCQEKCPTCRKVFGVLRGNQPPGKFTKSVVKMALPGYEECKTIRIIYDIPNGIQTVGLSSLSSLELTFCSIIFYKDRLVHYLCKLERQTEQFAGHSCSK